jgi:heme A synthase
VRLPLLLALLFMIGEVLIGAGIVLLKYVATDQSVGRAMWMGLHLINTFMLVGALGLVVRRAGGAGRWRISERGWVAFIGLVSVLAVLASGASGAIAALGDTLFPAKSIGQALTEDLSPTAHWLVKLRTTHPFIAIGAAFVLLFARQVIESVRRPALLGRGPECPRGMTEVSSAGLHLRIAVVSQIGLGFLNMMMLAPIWMQIVHLLVAQLLWLVLIRFVSCALEDESRETEALATVAGDFVDDAPVADQQESVEPLGELTGLGVAEDDRIAEAKADSTR